MNFLIMIKMGQLQTCNPQALKHEMLTIETRKSRHTETIQVSLDKNNKKGLYNKLVLTGGVTEVASLSGGIHSSVGSNNVSGSNVLKVMVEKVTVSDKVRSKWYSKEYLGDSFRLDLKKLPSTYIKKTSKAQKFPSPNKEKFQKFFEKHGQGFVMTGYYGGEATFKMKR